MNSIKRMTVLSISFMILVLSNYSCKDDETANSDFLGNYDVISNFTLYSGAVPPGEEPSEYIMFIEEHPSGAGDQILIRNIGNIGTEVTAKVSGLDFIVDDEDVISSYGTLSSDKQSMTFYFDEGYGHNNAVATKR